MYIRCMTIIEMIWCHQHNADRLLKLIEAVYRWLPLGTLVNNKVLIVHGGISDATDIQWLKTIDRHKVSFYFYSVQYYYVVYNHKIEKYFNSSTMEWQLERKLCCNVDNILVSIECSLVEQMWLFLLIKKT